MYNIDRPTRTPILSISIKDCEVQTFRAGGKGGQNQNKTESGVRVIHHPSGAIGESREERSQLQNKRNAFIRMAKTPKFQRWVKFRTLEMLGHESIESKVDRMLAPENLRVESQEPDGTWKPVKTPL